MIEHPCDYTETVARARASAGATGSYFIDDESSRLLFVGYTTAAAELAEQLGERGVKIVDRDTTHCLSAVWSRRCAWWYHGRLKTIYGD